MPTTVTSILFTGGGTAGHVTPNLALIEKLSQEGWDIHYVGSADSVEQGMVQKIGIPFYPISGGKLRRYRSLKNLLTPFKVARGILQSFMLLRRLKPDLVFSKGGFVAFPVVVGAWLNGIPILAHESDMTPGLANRLSFPFVNKICLTFEAGKAYFKRQDKIVVTGTPIRQALFHGDKARGLALCGFNDEKPCLLVIGGSLGAASINHCIRQSLAALTHNFQIIHLCGKGKIDSSYQSVKGYYQLEYADEQLAHLFACSDVVISRAGANSLYEILALAKPHVLIPLSTQMSRGDQLQNARYFEQLGISQVIDNEALNSENLLLALETIQHNQAIIIKKIHALKIASATERIVAIIKEQIHGIQFPKAI